MNLKDEATIMLGISLTFLSASLLIAIGFALFEEEIYIGIPLIILGYEFARKGTTMIWKHASQNQNKEKSNNG